MATQQATILLINNVLNTAQRLDKIPAHTEFDSAQIVALEEGQLVQNWRSWMLEADDVLVRRMLIGY